jgi:hypothetical protein
MFDYVRRLLAFFASISALIASRFLVFFDRDLFILPIAVLRLAMATH